MRSRKATPANKNPACEPEPQEQVVVPVVQEEIKIDKRTVGSGLVRVIKRIQESEHEIDAPLLKEEVQIERVPIDRPIDGIPPIPHRRRHDDHPDHRRSACGRAPAHA
jgi:stress response protein YsnF